MPKTYDVVVRNKDSNKVVYAKIIKATSAGHAKTILVKSLGIELSRSEYHITATKLR